MEVHDYYCFIQKNGQCLEQYKLCTDGKEEVGEDGKYSKSYSIGAGNNKCTIVLVPETLNVNSLPLSDFKEFETLHWTCITGITGTLMRMIIVILMAMELTDTY